MDGGNTKVRTDAGATRPAVDGISLNLEDLRAHAPAMADAVLDRVRAAAPAGEVPDAVTLRNLRLGAGAAVGCFLQRLEGSTAPLDLTVFVAHGRAQQVAGRSLPELLAFYRLGGLAMWERTSLLPEAGDLTAPQLFALGTEVLSLVDELSIAAADGYTASEAETRRRERARRERLLSLLLSDPPRVPEELRAAAAAAGWALPASVRVAVAALPLEPEGDVVLAGPARVLAGAVEGGRCALVVAADGEEEAWLLRAARAIGLERPVVVGPAVAPDAVARAAAQAVALHGRMADAEEDVVRCEDHEVELLLLAEPGLARAVAERRLSALDGVPAGQRERLVETLAAWLADPGRPQAMADRLGLHVQTVRYRIGRLRDVFGAALDDPEARFELGLALRVRASLPQDDA